nr:hypothetical protein [Tanacetum cinerariifolium]
MPRRRLRKKSVKKLVERRVAKAIEEYEKTRADSINAGGSGSASTGGSADVQGCSYKTFMNCKPHSFNGTEGVVGLKRRALTWWNGNVQSLGLANASQIPWSNLKAMMTTEYCPETEIQKMEQELWTLTLKGDDIEAYNNRFHELALMCPELETAKAYAAAPPEGRGYEGNLPRCNHCNSHHNGQCPPKCRKCQRTGHQEKDC